MENKQKKVYLSFSPYYCFSCARHRTKYVYFSFNSHNSPQRYMNNNQH